MKEALRRCAGRSDYACLTGLCTLAYFVSYVSRINMGACMVEMIQSGFAPKNTVALALSVCSVTYGLGQIVSGWLGDRCRPQNVILCGFAVTAAVNLSVAVLPEPGLLVAFWAVNGFAQAMMWPPMLAIIAAVLTGDDYSRSCVWVGRGGALGTMLVYALSPVLIRGFGVRSVFFVSGLLAAGMAAVWKLGYERRFGGLAVRASVKRDEPGETGPGLRPSGIFLIGAVMLAIALQGMLRDGVTNWLPTFVSDVFRLDSSSAILTGVLLPVFHILSSQVFNEIHLRLIRNELLCAAVIFAASLAATALCVALMDVGAATVVLLAVLVACMHGVNHLLVSLVPRHFRKYGHMALISGVFNSSTYLGSAVSTYGIALVSEAFGWRSTVVMWAVIAAAGTLVCAVLVRKWKRFTA